MRIPILVTPSTGDLVSCKEMKDWLKVDADETADDDLIRSLIEMAHRKWEAYTNRAALTQTYQAIGDESPCSDEIRLWPSPLVSIVSITGYTDTDGSTGTGTAMSSSEYFVDTAHEPGRVVAFGGAAWPTATRSANAFVVEYTAGYSSESSGVPDQVKADVKRLVARAYEYRGDAAAVGSAMDDVLKECDLAMPEWG